MRHATGDWDGLEEHARRLLEATAEVPIVALFDHLVVGSLLTSRGELDDAVSHLTTALLAAQAAKLPQGLVTAAGRLARIHLARDDPESAREVANLGLEAVRYTGVWVWAAELAPVAVESFLACGQETTASDFLGRLAAGLAGRDAPAAEAALTASFAVAAEANGAREEAVALYAETERLWSRRPRPYEATLARERQGHLLLAHGESSGANLLLGALDRFGELGASWDVERVKAILRDHSVALPYPWRGGRRSYGNQLSPREREVVHLAAQGYTDREIAKKVFLSPRTVEGHVAAAKRKLGVRSRHELKSVEMNETRDRRRQ